MILPKKHTLLVVDDEPNVCDSVHDLLRREFKVLRAKNAEEGVKAITSSYVDWIVQNPEQARFVLYNRGYLSKNATTEALDLQTKSNGNLLRDWFKPNIKNGNIKSLPPECYPSLLLGPAHDYARLWLSGRTRKTLKEFREIFIDAAWNAVRPVSGG